MTLFRSPVVVGCMLSLITIAFEAQATSLEGTWYGFTYERDFRAYKFLPDGVVHTETHNGFTENGNYELFGDNIEIELPSKRGRAGKSLVIKGQIENGIIQARASVKPNSWDIKLTRAKVCVGKVQMCGGGIFCQTINEPVRYWRPSKPGQSATIAELLSDFDDFYDFFNCAVQLKQHDMYISRINFPFKKVMLKLDTQKPVLVDKDDFNVRMINPEEDHNVIPPGGTSIPKATTDRASVYRKWLFPNTEMEWIFEKSDMQWFLTGAEYRDETSRKLPWFQLKNCSQDKLKGFENTKPGQNEDFEEFVVHFYCALKLRKSELYLSRIKFPLPYTLRTTEGNNHGKMKKETLKAWQISTVDGGEVPLSYSHNNEHGKAHIESHSAGTSHGWVFKRIGPNWYLVEVDIGSY